MARSEPDRFQHRDRLFAHYDRGALTATDVELRFIDLLVEAEDDEAALELCDSLPAWFRDHLRRSLHDLQSSDYHRLWYAMEDARTLEEARAEARRHQAFLRRLTPEILARIH